jgi:hypothetical protein
MAAKFQGNQDVYKKYIEQVTVLYHNRQDLRMYLEILLSISAVVVFGIFAIRPTVTTIIGLYGEIKEKRQTIELMDKKIDDLVTAQSVLEQQRVRVATLNQAVPDEPLLEKQVRQIEGIAKKNGVNIVTMGSSDVLVLGKAEKRVTDKNKKDGGADIPYPDAEYFPITVGVEGNFRSVSSFLRDLENMRRPISQQSSSLAAGRGGPGSLILNISGLVSYFNKDE